MCSSSDRSGAPAAFYPTLAKVEVDQQVFAPHAPASIRPARFGDEERYPAAWGALCHEAGAAASFLVGAHADVTYDLHDRSNRLCQGVGGCSRAAPRNID